MDLAALLSRALLLLLLLVLLRFFVHRHTHYRFSSTSTMAIAPIQGMLRRSVRTALASLTFLSTHCFYNRARQSSTSLSASRVV